MKAFQRRIKQVAEAEGLPYGDRKMTYNSRLSQELGSWANTQADGELLHDALYRAYFVDNQDISNTDVLLNIVQQVGLDVAQARIVLEQRSFAKQVDTDWQRARSIGITGVPTFVSADLQVVGCQSYDVLQKFLKHLRKLKAEAAPEA